MGIERWAVLPAGDVDGEEQFILQFRDIPTAQTPPFTRTSEPMSETELRIELEKLDVPKADADAAIARARQDKVNAKTE